jgi:hypothetical protein
MPLSVIADLTACRRMLLYEARDSGRVSADTAELLTPIVLWQKLQLIQS